MNDVKKTVDSLSRRKLALLSERLKAGIVKTPRREISRRSNPTAPCPLSFAQQRLWFLDQLIPNNPLYNIPDMTNLERGVNLDALERAINEIVRRHEILRTRFEVEEGEPVQVIDRWEPQRLEVIDLRRSTREARAKELRRMAREEAETGFDLSKGPLLRVKVLKLEDEGHVMLFTMHHIVSDAWSMEIMIREMGTLYRAYSAGEESPLAELPIQYADFAVWQREYLAGGALESKVAYWKEQLKDAAVLELPADHARPAAPSYRGGLERIELDNSLSQELRLLGQRDGATMFMVLMAAFKALLMRYSGEEDVVVGTVIANRTLREVEGLIGFFVNTLALRTDLGGNPSFRELIRREREVALGAYGRQEVPFEKLVEEINPERDLSRSPLFQALMTLQKAGREGSGPSKVEISGSDEETRTAKFDLTLNLTERETSIQGGLEYSLDLYERETIRRMARHYGRVVAEVARDAGQRIREIELMSAEEKEQVIVEFNRTEREYEGVQCIHELIEAQAELNGSAIAVVYEEERVSYEELNRRANQLARYLIRRGVGLEDRVGICIERRLEMVVGLLGILKAGGAYVPLDPNYPEERLEYMLKDAGIKALVTQERLKDILGEQGAETICFDADWEAIDEESGRNPGIKVWAENQAYAIYTSGSTGRPKGVSITHRSAVTLQRWGVEVFGEEELKGVLASTSICFDLSVFELMAPLGCGGKVVLAENALSLPELRAAEEVRLINTVPSAVRELVGSLGIPETVETVNLAGEALRRELAQQIYESGRVRRVLNLYGPTEDTTYTTWTEVGDGGAEEPTLGRPIANTEVYILDQEMRPVPIGVYGEIYISGEGLARGYLNRMGMTAEKFLPNPLGKREGERMYRTGDFGRYEADGKIAFQGRKDDQVKLRGYRIELGEIEAVLDEHESVIQSVVVLKEDDMAETRLVAYAVCDGERAPSVYELRSYLKEKLPEHMAPAWFVWLEQMPLTPNGKVDRKALPALKEGRIERQTSYIPPRDSFELQIVQIWEQVLGIQPIGVTDNFFELGGHSLLAVSLMAKIRNTFKQDLPLSALFQGATIEKLGAMLRRDAGSRSWSCLVELRASGSKPPLFFAHPGGGGVLCYFDLARCLGSDQPFYGFQAPGFYGEQPSYTRLEDMAALYIEAMMTVQPEGPYLLGGWSLGGVIAYEMAQQLVAQGQSVGQLLLLDTGPWGHSEEDIGEHEDHLEHEEPARMDDALMLVGFFQGDLPVSEEDLKPFEGAERIDYVLKKAISMNLAPPGLEGAQARSILKIARANEKAMYNYKAQTYPGAVTLFKTAGNASMPHSVGPEFNEEMMKRIQDPTKGWGELAAGGVRVIDVPGDHGTMVRKPYVEMLALRIKECLNGAETLGS